MILNIYATLTAHTYRCIGYFSDIYLLFSYIKYSCYISIRVYLLKEHDKSVLAR